NWNLALDPSGGPHVHIPGLAPDAIVLTPDQAPGFVAERAAAGSDYFKIVVEAPGEGGPDEPTLKALVKAAHNHGLKVIAHGVTPGAYTLALNAGADILTHVPVSGPINPADLDRAGPVIPTLTMMKASTAGRGVPYDAAAANAATLYLAGKVIMAGTDANDVGGVPYHVDYGDSLHTELELLVDIGMSPVEALRAATSVPAGVFGLTDRGAVEPGLRADLVLVDGDPLADIRSTRAITRVWCAGVEVQR
ncbi:amidohydrolase family protein, partial [Kibdelosporangium lantanae]